MSDNQPEPTLEQRKVIYHRARRGLKELIIILTRMPRAHYLQADSQEQQILQNWWKKDPDLLDWFYTISRPSQNLLEFDSQAQIIKSLI